MKKKFTLIEILIGIVIITILAAIVIPNVKDFKSNSITSMVNSNVRMLQTAVDTYALKHDGDLPSGIQPTLEQPQFVDIDKLYPNYIKKKPDYNKVKDQKYWVDAYGKVWGATVDSPSNIYDFGSKMEWTYQKEVKAYNLYEIEKNAVTGAIEKRSIRLNKSISIEQLADRISIEKGTNTYLLSSIDQYGLESVPVGLNYDGYQDWFAPLLNREGSYTFEIESDELMYWDGFRTIEDKPNGTSINFEFSVLNDKGEFTSFTPNFDSLIPSKHLKIKIEMKGANGVNPTLYDMRVFYHYAEDESKIVNLAKSGSKVVSSTNLKSDGTAINPLSPVVVIDEIVLPPDKQVYDVQFTDSYAMFNRPMMTILVKDTNGQFVQVDSFSAIPQGATIRIKREFDTGEGVKTSTPVVLGTSYVNTINPETKVESSGDPQLYNPEWKTVNQLSFFANSGDGQVVRWLRAEIVDKQPENTRILYRYAVSNGIGWSGAVDDMSKLPESRSIRVMAYLQVKISHLGKVTEPTVESIRIVNEKGVSDLSLVKPTVMIIPKKDNNSKNDFISTATNIDWTYQASDPRGKKIIKEEWAGDKRTNYSTPGTYEVRVRVLNESNYWSDWLAYKFEVKQEKPTAIISSNVNDYDDMTPITWKYDQSVDPDEDGIVKAEWGGDVRTTYPVGTYTITLKVQDGEGNWSNTVSKTFTVYKETLFSGLTTPAYDYNSSTYTNLGCYNSTSYITWKKDLTGKTVSITAKANGYDPLANLYVIDSSGNNISFGYNNSTVSTVSISRSHVRYDIVIPPNASKIKLTMNGRNLACSGLEIYEVNVLPFASITMNPKVAYVNQPITWSYTNLNQMPDYPIVNVEWQNNAPMFTAVGTYQVKVRIQDSRGVWSDWSVKNIDAYSDPLNVWYGLAPAAFDNNLTTYQNLGCSANTYATWENDLTGKTVSIRAQASGYSPTMTISLVDSNNVAVPFKYGTQTVSSVSVTTGKNYDVVIPSNAKKIRFYSNGNGYACGGLYIYEVKTLP